MASYDVKWLVENKVVDCYYFGDLSAEIIQESVEKLIAMIDSADSPLVHFIVDLSEIDQYPILLPQIIPLVKTLYSKDKMGWLIVYGRDDRIIDFLSAVTTSMFNVRHRSFSTREEVIAFLNDVDETLPDLNSIQVG